MSDPDVLRLTGEQMASIQPPVDSRWFIDWDEHEDFVVAALSTPPPSPPELTTTEKPSSDDTLSVSPPLDVERLARAIWHAEANRYGEDGWTWDDFGPDGKRMIIDKAEAIAREYARSDE